MRWRPRAFAPLAALPRARGNRNRIAVGVFVRPASGRMSRARRATLLLSMEAALRGDPRLIVLDKDLRLARRADEFPSKAIAAARTSLQRGFALLERGKHEVALKRFQDADRKLAAIITHASKRDVARAQFAIGLAHTAAGDYDLARDAFERLLIWRPEYLPTGVSRELSDKVAPIWQAAKDTIVGGRRGTIELITEPNGALAYVDGVFKGFTPTSAEGLTV
ncbi:MAG: hypothetical protein AAGC55_27665, partial [Myxococcota bacterium]